MKVAYNILHKLGTRQEPMVRPGDRVSTSAFVASLNSMSRLTSKTHRGESYVFELGYIVNLLTLEQISQLSVF